MHDALPMTEQPSRSAARGRLMRLLTFTTTTVIVGGGFGATLGVLRFPGVPSATVGSLPSPPWWAFVAALLGAVVTGLLTATYAGAPRGAEVTVCDLRWPLIGVVGLTLAIERAVPGSFIGDLFGTSPVVQSLVQPLIGVASLALLVWALRSRLLKERALLAAANDPDTDTMDAACSTCRPLFGSK